MQNNSKSSKPITKRSSVKRPIITSSAQTEQPSKLSQTQLRGHIHGVPRFRTSHSVQIIQTGLMRTPSALFSQEISQTLAKNIRQKLNSRNSNCSCWLCNVNTVLMTVPRNMSFFIQMRRKLLVRVLTFIRGTGKHLKKNFNSLLNKCYE